jgi:hypothetical protein
MITVTLLAMASTAIAADRIVHYEHFTADW